MRARPVERVSGGLHSLGLVRCKIKGLCLQQRPLRSLLSAELCRRLLWVEKILRRQGTGLGARGAKF